MKKIITICGMALLMLACQEEKIITSKGSIVGFVKLVDEKGIEITDKSGIKVILDENISALTNASGRFELTGIAPGTYQPRFEKEGFGTVKKFNFGFAAGNVPGVISDITLVGLPNISVTSKVLEPATNYIKVKGTMTETESFYFMYHFVEKPEADISDYLSQYGYSFCCFKTTTFEHDVPVPVSLPSTAYLVAYAVSTGNQQGQYNYYDYEKGKSVNPAVKKLFDPVRIR